MDKRDVAYPPVESVDFHFWQPCNMRCAFCFGRFRDVRKDALPEGHLPPEDAKQVVQLLGQAGFAKITFAGGEPLLCPWFPALVEMAKRSGMTTSVVTNGSLLDEALVVRLRDHLDWLVLSIDSVDPQTLTRTGRLAGGHPMGEADYMQLCRMVVESRIALKINTVVTQVNCNEDLSTLILATQPRRWKIMQALPIRGQNDRTITPFLVEPNKFDQFVIRHKAVTEAGIAVIAERNDDMIGSYAMVDPAGRFFDNVAGSYTYSEPILSVGVAAAIGQVSVDRAKFLRRGGRYDWDAPAAEARLVRQRSNSGPDLSVVRGA